MSKATKAVTLASIATMLTVSIEKSWNQRLTAEQKAANELAEQAKEAIPHPVIAVPFSEKLDFSAEDAQSLLERFLQTEVVRYKNGEGIEESILENTFDLAAFKASVLEFKYPMKLTGDATKTFHEQLDKLGTDAEGERADNFVRIAKYIKSKFPEVSVDSIAETLSAWKGLVAGGGSSAKSAEKQLATIESNIIPMLNGDYNEDKFVNVQGISRSDVANIFTLALSKSTAKVEEEELDFSF